MQSCSGATKAFFYNPASEQSRTEYYLYLNKWDSLSRPSEYLLMLSTEIAQDGLLLFSPGILWNLIKAYKFDFSIKILKLHFILIGSIFVAPLLKRLKFFWNLHHPL